MNPYALPTVLVNTEVLFIAFESAIINKEKIFKSGILGISLASAGSVVIAFNDGSQSANISYGDFLALSGAAFMAAYTMIGSRQRKK